MFSPETPMRLHGCNGKTRKDDDGNRIRVVQLTFMLQPFTPEMANDFGVKGRLFNINSGEPLPDIQSIKLKIAKPLQKMSLAPAKDVAAPVVVNEVDVQPFLSVTADREGPVFTAYFSVEFDYPTANDLLWLFQKVTEQLFATFEPAQGDMLTGEEAAAAQGPKLRKKKKGEQPALEEETEETVS